MKGTLLIMVLTIALSAKAQQEFNLYKGTVPNSKGCAVKEIWTDNNSSRGNVKQVTIPTLKSYLPDNKNTLTPAVIICPGGGYNMLSIFDGGYETAGELKKAGIAAFVLKYRLSDPICNEKNDITALQDAQQAMLVIKTNAAKWHIDPEKIGYLGFSAGGHLSAMAATHFNDKQINAGNISLRPAFVILAYPVISFTDSLTSKNSKTRSNLLGSKVSFDQIKWFSPELNVSAETPPAYIVHASNDSTSLVENSIVYYRALHQKRISAELKIYQMGGHGFANYNKAENDHWLPAAINWLRLNRLL
jgi:acetyl esterase/lipase